MCTQKLVMKINTEDIKKRNLKTNKNYTRIYASDLLVRHGISENTFHFLSRDAMQAKVAVLTESWQVTLLPFLEMARPTNIPIHILPF